MHASPDHPPDTVCFVSILGHASGTLFHTQAHTLECNTTLETCEFGTTASLHTVSVLTLKAMSVQESADLRVCRHKSMLDTVSHLVCPETWQMQLIC